MDDKTKVNILGIYLFILLSFLVSVATLTYIYEIGNTLIRSLIYVACSGGIGGAIYSIRGFYKNLVEGKFDLIWTWWYIYRPFVSVVIGVFVYFLIVGGLLSVGSISEVNYSKSIMFYSAISFLAGFSFTQFADKLDEIAETIFSKKKDEKG